MAAGPSTAGDMTATAVADRPRKKLSFREPEIMGYYMQMKQGVTNRLSRKHKNKAGKGGAGAGSAGEESDKLVTTVGDDEDLEVNLFVIDNIVFSTIVLVIDNLRNTKQQKISQT